LTPAQKHKQQRPGISAGALFLPNKKHGPPAKGQTVHSAKLNNLKFRL